jgi:hypothetical protein
MIPPSFSHKQFIRFVRNKAHRYGGLRTDHRHFKSGVRWKRLT